MSSNTLLYSQTYWDILETKNNHWMIMKHFLDIFHKASFHVLLQISNEEKQKSQMEPVEVVILQESKASYKIHIRWVHSSLFYKNLQSRFSWSMSVIHFLLLSLNPSASSQHIVSFIHQEFPLTSKCIFVLFLQEMHLYYLFYCIGRFIYNMWIYIYINFKSFI